MSNAPTILTKTASTGQQIEIRCREYLPGQHVAALYLDGKFVAQGTPTPLTPPKGDVTHWLGKRGMAVGLTRAEADTISAALAAADAAYRSSAAGSAQALRSERERLARTLRGAEDDLAAARERLMDVYDGAAPTTATAALAEAVAAAAQRLQEFDAANPEILGAIREERARAAARFEAAN